MLIELRVRPGDFRFRSVLRAVAANHLVRHGNVARITHLSLYGSFDVSPTRLPDLRRVVSRVCSRYRALAYLVDDYELKSGPHGNTIAFRIVPSPTLSSFRKDLIRALAKDFPSSQGWDQEGADSWLHITIGWNLSGNESDRVWDFLNRDQRNANRALEEPRRVRRVRPYLPLETLRVTILGEKIYAECDLPRQEILTRRQALDWHEWCKTLRAYRIWAGIQSPEPGILKRLIRQSNKRDTYFISDLHLDHGNIIRYCARPFCRNVGEMNRVLVTNWNRSVAKADRVYYLGDLACGKGHKPTRYWWARLSGDKVFIQGNHDDATVSGITYNTLSVNDGAGRTSRNYAIIHDPNELPDGLRTWVKENNAWIIHGDKHNNNVRDYPFINGEKKRINVCAELVDYRPISLSLLTSPQLAVDTIRRMDTLRSTPIRW